MFLLCNLGTREQTLLNGGSHESVVVGERLRRLLKGTHRVLLIVHVLLAQRQGATEQSSHVVMPEARHIPKQSDKEFCQAKRGKVGRSINGTLFY